MHKVCFLDRDGVLIVEKCYLSDPDHVELTPGAPDVIKRLHAEGYLCIVITNQAGVARGYYNEQSINLVHDKINDLLSAEGETIDAYYYCPHHPEGTEPEYTKICNCRKPATGMIEQACSDFDIDLKSSFIIGDKLTDIQTGFNAGCKTGILVRTGHGESEIESKDTTGIIIQDSIKEAVNFYLDEMR